LESNKEVVETLKKPYICPVRDNCPYHYDACTDPTKFCRIIEDTPEHFQKEINKQ